MHLERAAHTATLLPNGLTLLAGGFGQGDNSYTDSAELYDPATGEFAFTGKMAAGRCCHTATRLPDGRVLIAGGFNGRYLSAAELFDPATGTFARTGALTTSRMDHMAVLLDNGKVLPAGRFSPAQRSTIPSPAGSRRQAAWRSPGSPTPSRSSPTGAS
jgi:hypothetical protein